MSDAAEKKGGIWYWVAGGCAALVLVGVVLSCVGPMLFGLWFEQFLGGGGMMPPMPTPVSGPPGSGLDIPDPPPPLGAVETQEVATDARAVVFAVTESTRMGVAVGDTCTFNARLMAATSRCRTEITCGSIMIYGGPGQGYFDCTMAYGTPFSGWDYQQSSGDGDAMITIDGTANTIRIEDDATGTAGAFVIAGTLSSVAETIP